MPRFFRLAEEHYYQHGEVAIARRSAPDTLFQRQKLCLAAAEQWAIQEADDTHCCSSFLQSVLRSPSSAWIIKQIPMVSLRMKYCVKLPHPDGVQDATNWDNQHHFCVTFCRRKCFRYLEINHITDLDRYITQYPPQRDRNVIKSFTAIIVARHFSVFYEFLHIFCYKVKQNSQFRQISPYWMGIKYS